MLLPVLCLVVVAVPLGSCAPGPVVQLECGPAVGEVWKEKNSILAFLGIPYAAPPTGSRRFQPPSTLMEANTCWKGTYPATEAAPVCAQKSGNGVSGSEDCLYVNVWTPSLPSSNSSNPKRPVMAYIHGGSLINGCSACVPNSPFIFAEEGAVSVSFSYRLNVLGFLALDVLSQHDKRGVSGNYGFLDQIAALQWIQRNIAAFGGDPNNVLIWGQSSGGTSLYALIASPLAKGLFSAVVAMSASPNISVPLSTASSIHLSTYVPLSPCASSSDLYGCLMNASFSSLVQSYSDNYWNPPWLFGLATPNSTIAPLSVIDGNVLQQPLLQALASLDGSDVPFIVGNVAAEPDLAPVDVVYHLNPSQFEFFLKDRFSAFGSSLAPDALQLYPADDYASAQQQYDEISCDYGTICGNIQVAATAAKSFKSPVYNYIATYLPVQHICNPMNSYCTQYPYHMMDMADADVDGWFMNGTDYEFGALVRQMLFNLVTNHSLPSPWQRIPSSGAIPTTLLDLPPTTSYDVRAEKCSFWSSRGFDQFWWQN